MFRTIGYIYYEESVKIVFDGNNGELLTVDNDGNTIVINSKDYEILTEDEAIAEWTEDITRD